MTWFQRQKQMLVSIKESATKRTKVVILGAVCFGFGVLAWGMINRVLTHSSFEQRIVWEELVVAFVTFFLFVVVLGLVGALVRDHLEALVILLVASFAYAVWFGFAIWAIITMFIIFLGGAYFISTIWKEEGERVRFSLARTLEPGLNIMLVACLLAISITTYGVTAERSSTGSTTPLERMGEFLGASVNQSLRIIVPGYRPDETIDDFLVSIALRVSGDEQQLSVVNVPELLAEVSGVNSEQLLASLTPEQRAALEQNSTAQNQALQDQISAVLHDQLQQGRTKLLETLKVQDAPGLTIGNAVEQATTTALVKRFGHYERFLPPLFGLAVFLALSALMFAYHICISLIADGVFLLLRKLKIVQVRRMSAEVEVVTFRSTP